MKKYFAEFFGTFWLVFGGCGSAVLAAAYPELGIGFAGVALAFGLTVLTMAYAVGHISGGHFNPAVSIGLFIGGRFNGKDLLPYIVSQVIGAIAAAGVLYLIASGKTGFDAVASGFASNGFGEHSPNGYDMMAALLIEFVLTTFFLIIIMGSTDKLAPAGFAPIAIGLGLTLIHLISIPVTNTSTLHVLPVLPCFKAAGLLNSCGCSGWLLLPAQQLARLFTASCWLTTTNNLDGMTFPVWLTPQTDRTQVAEIQTYRLTQTVRLFLPCYNTFFSHILKPSCKPYLFKPISLTECWSIPKTKPSIPMPYSYKRKTATGLLGTTNKPPCLPPTHRPIFPAFG